jgi:ElaB/YqjD/DUF883 family membrane-anchored ribosome-binding protein
MIDLAAVAALPADDPVEVRLAAIEDGLDGLAERIEALTRDTARETAERLAGIETRLERLQDAVIDGFADVRDRVVDEMVGVMSRIEQANVAVRTTFGADLAAVRADLADALDEVRGQVESTIGAANSTIASTLEQHGAAAHTVLEAVQGEVRSGLTDISRSLGGQFDAIRSVTGTLGGSTDRLVGAGQALLAYLGERDQWLERERDRVLHDVLEEFAGGLSGRGRRSLTGRMRNVVDRRRDARDAERFRRAQGEPTVIEVPSVPPELAALSEPVFPAESDDSFTVVEPARSVAEAPVAGTKPAASGDRQPKSVSNRSGPAKKAAKPAKRAASSPAAPTRSPRPAGKTR